MKRGRGIKGLDDKSRGMEILMTEAFAKINPTDPLISTSILAKHVVYYESRKRELKIRLMNEGR
jgi:hypothetical protein